MTDREEEGVEVVVEPLNLKENNRDSSHAADTKEEYDKIL